MAIRAGSEDGPPKAGRKKATPDHANVTPEAFREAVKIMAAANAALAEANEARKGVRKRIKAMGIELGDMDAIVRMSEWERPEVREVFERRQKYAEWIGLPVGTQADLFAGMSDEEIQAREWHAAGRTAFLSAKERLIPENVPEEFEAHWTAGYDGKEVPAIGAAPAPKPEPEVAAAGQKKRGRPKKDAASNVVPLREGPGDDTAPGFEQAGDSKPH